MSHWGRDNDTRNAQRKAENELRFAQVKVIGMTVLSTTDKAILVTETEAMPDGPRQWVPKSQMRDCSPTLSSVERDDEIEFSVPRWLADEKEFLYE
jgi:hypothetical protein